MSGGQIQQIMSFTRDVTAPKQAEEASRGTEQRLELAVDAGKMGNFDRDLKTGDVVWSNHLTKLFGIAPEKFGGTFESFMQLVHPDDRAGTTAKIQHAVATGEDYVIEYRVTWPDGSIHWLESRGRLFHAGSDRMIGAVIDITERKITEERLLNQREQLRSLASQLSLTEERERRRIARDLHDGIGQNLALALLKLRNQPESGTTGIAGLELERARRLINEALSSVQSLTYDLSPPILYDLGLEAALEWLCEHFHARHGLKVAFSADQRTEPLGEDLRFLLFRAARELLVNVVKHASARTAKLSVCRRGHHLELAVEDDGKGFATPLTDVLAGVSPDSGGGFGLFSIRERVEHFEGKLEISSLRGRTRAAVTVPLQGFSDADRGVGDNRSAP